MIASALLALQTAPASAPDEIDRFIQVCVDGRQSLLDASARELTGHDVPPPMLYQFGSPTKTHRIYRFGEQAPVDFSVIQSKGRGNVSWSCAMLTKLDSASAKKLLLDRLADRGLADVTDAIWNPVYERAGQSTDVPLGGGNHIQLPAGEDRPEAVLQTSDPTYRISVPTRQYGGYLRLSVMVLDENGQKQAAHDWRVHEKSRAIRAAKGSVGNE